MRTRLYVAGVLGGLALLAVVVVVVLAFGRKDPSPPSLKDHPNSLIPGEILYVNQDFCFVRATASGASHTRLACIPENVPGGRLYWFDENTAGILRYDQRGAVLWHVDLQTGAMTDTGKVIDTSGDKPSPGVIYGGAYAPDGTFASADEDGKLSILIDGKRTVIAEFDIPDYNQPQVITWSPDSQWMALQYYPRRADGPEIWIVSRDGATKGTLADDASGSSVAWRIGADVQPPNPQ